MTAWMYDTIHIQIEIVKLHIIGVGLRYVNGHMGSIYGLLLQVKCKIGKPIKSL